MSAPHCSHERDNSLCTLFSFSASRVKTWSLYVTTHLNVNDVITGCYSFAATLQERIMTHQVSTVTGCLAVTAAAKSDIEASTVGNITVRLSFDTKAIIPSANGTVEREAERALAVLSSGGGSGDGSGGAGNLTLDLTVQQAFQLLSELEDIQVSLISADR